MAIKPYKKAALAALSRADIDIKKNYKLVRKIETAAKKPRLKLMYQMWDHCINGLDHEIPVRIFFPAKEKKCCPVFLFFHGGGWVTGNIDSYSKVCQALARHTGHIVAAVDYRLAPEYRFPAGLMDCYSAARELFAHPDLLGTSTDQITIIGDSAGGNLAAAVSLMARNRGEFLPQRQILIYPATANDHSETSPFASIRENGTGYLLTAKRIQDYMDLYINNEQDLLNPYFAPLLATDLSNQPDTLIITAQYDPLRDEGEAYGRRLAASGNRVEMYRMPDAFHGFFSLPSHSLQVRKSYAMIRHFLGGASV